MTLIFPKRPQPYLLYRWIKASGFALLCVLCAVGMLILIFLTSFAELLAGPAYFIRWFTQKIGLADDPNKTP